MTQPSFQVALQMMLEDIGRASALPLRDFDSLFPAIAVHNQCFIKLLDPSFPELVGEYRVVDLYCQDPSCHCHKVSLVFLGPYQKAYATVSYGWKSKTYYHKWGLDKKGSQALAHGFLDPWAPQSEYASHFLKVFLCSLKRDPKFIARLKSRYALFKKTLKEDPSLIIVDFPHDKPKGADLADNVIPFSPPKHL